MAQPYLTDLQSIVERMRASGVDLDPVTCKHFFSGAAAFHNDTIFMSLSPAGLALKLSGADCELLFGQGAEPLRYFPAAPVKKGYAVLPPHLVNDQEALIQWVARSIDFVET